MSYYRIMLLAEDGVYCIVDRLTRQQAEKRLKRIESSYGEGQMLFIEQYKEVF